MFKTLTKVHRLYNIRAGDTLSTEHAHVKRKKRLLALIAYENANETQTRCTYCRIKTSTMKRKRGNEKQTNAFRINTNDECHSTSSHR